MFNPTDRVRITLMASEWTTVLEVLETGMWRVTNPLILQIRQQAQEQMPTLRGNGQQAVEIEEHADA